MVKGVKQIRNKFKQKNTKNNKMMDKIIWDAVKNKKTPKIGIFDENIEFYLTFPLYPYYHSIALVF